MNLCEPTDEYSAHSTEVDDAPRRGGDLEGRPYEIRRARAACSPSCAPTCPGCSRRSSSSSCSSPPSAPRWLAPYGPVEGNPSTANIPPVWDGGTWSHVLGTDTQGYDVLSRLMYGARTTLLIGFAVVFIAGTFGIVLGLIAGYRGGRTDRWLMRWVDVQVAFPGLLIALIMIAVLGPSMGSLIFVLSFNGWMVYARMTRGVVLSAKERPYVEAAELVGCKPRRVMFKHILPEPHVGARHPRRARVRPHHPRRGDAVVPRTRAAVPRGLARGDGQLRSRRVLLAPPPRHHPRRRHHADRARRQLPGVVAARRLRPAVEREKRYAAGSSVRRPASASGTHGVRARRDRRSSVTRCSRSTTSRSISSPAGARCTPCATCRFSIGRGETLGLVGESGSGKSVTAQALLGMIELPGRIVGGDVRWKGESLVHAPHAGRRSSGSAARRSRWSSRTR